MLEHDRCPNLHVQMSIDSLPVTCSHAAPPLLQNKAPSTLLTHMPCFCVTQTTACHGRIVQTAVMLHLLSPLAPCRCGCVGRRKQGVSARLKDKLRKRAGRAAAQLGGVERAEQSKPSGSARASRRIISPLAALLLDRGLSPVLESHCLCMWGPEEGMGDLSRDRACMLACMWVEEARHTANSVSCSCSPA